MLMISLSVCPFHTGVCFHFRYFFHTSETHVFTASQKKIPSVHSPRNAEPLGTNPSTEGLLDHGRSSAKVPGDFGTREGAGTGGGKRYSGRIPFTPAAPLALRSWPPLDARGHNAMPLAVGWSIPLGCGAGSYHGLLAFGCQRGGGKSGWGNVCDLASVGLWRKRRECMYINYSIILTVH